MDAVEFIKTRARMCKNLSCGQCPLKFFCSFSFFDQVEVAEKAASTLEQWAKEHPVKTRQSELLKLFPNTPCYQDGCIDMCPCEVGCLLMEGDDSVCVHNEDGVRCEACKHDFWLKEIE